MRTVHEIRVRCGSIECREQHKPPTDCTAHTSEELVDLCGQLQLPPGVQIHRYTIVKSHSHQHLVNAGTLQCVFHKPLTVSITVLAQYPLCRRVLTACNTPLIVLWAS